MRALVPLCNRPTAFNGHIVTVNSGPHPASEWLSRAGVTFVTLLDETAHLRWCPPTGTNSMPRRRRTQTSAVRSLTQPRGRLAANQAASGTYQHHWTPSKPPYTTDSPSGRLSSLQRPFLFLLVALRNTVLSGKRKRNRADKNIVVGRYACKVGFGSALVWQEAPEYALRTARSKARTNVDLVHLNCCSETEKPRGTV